MYSNYAINHDKGNPNARAMVCLKRSSLTKRSLDLESDGLWFKASIQHIGRPAFSLSPKPCN